MCHERLRRQIWSIDKVLFYTTEAFFYSSSLLNLFAGLYLLLHFCLLITNNQYQMIKTQDSKNLELKACHTVVFVQIEWKVNKISIKMESDMFSGARLQPLNNNSVITDSEVPLDKVYPALLQSFGIIFLGYLAAK